MSGRIQSPLRLLWIWTLLGLANFFGTWLHLFLPRGDGHDVQGYLLGRDFANVWFGAKQVMAGKASHLFNPPEYLADMRQLLGEQYPRHNFAYPPHILPLILVFGLAGYMPSLILWSVAGAALLFFLLKNNPMHSLPWRTALVAALSPAAIFNLVFGQNGAFTAAFMLGGLYFSESRPIRAGVLLGLLTVKPHLGILIPLVLLMRRNWKCAASACVTALSLMAASFLFWGVTPWHDYAVYTVPYMRGFLDGPWNIYNPLMPGVWADMVRLFQGGAAGYVLYAAAAVFALVATVKAVQRDGLTPRSVLVIALSTMVVLPYGYNYDMVAVGGALAVYLATLDDIAPGPFVIFGLLWALPAALVQMKLVPFPTSSLVMLSALTCLHFSRACGKPQTR